MLLLLSNQLFHLSDQLSIDFEELSIGEYVLNVLDICNRILLHSRVLTFLLFRDLLWYGEVVIEFRLENRCSGLVDRQHHLLFLMVLAILDVHLDVEILSLFFQ